MRTIRLIFIGILFFMQTAVSFAQGKVPLYGYGLSYTQLEYGDIRLTATEIDQKEELTASIAVKNSGKVAGAEVIQLYIRDLVGSITRPVKELKGFDKIFSKAGETKTVNFKITPDLLKFYNHSLEFVAEPGEFTIMIGGNSRDVKTAQFTLK